MVRKWRRLLRESVAKPLYRKEVEFVRAIYQMQYNALNLLDEICTVEITVDEDNRVLHILDLDHAVSPIYYFVKKQFQLNDEFYKMADVLIKKKILFLDNGPDVSQEQWLQNTTVYFYSGKPAVHVYKNDRVESLNIHPFIVRGDDLREAYLKRIGVI